MTGQGVAEEGPRVCTSCGAENPPLARFCNTCGARLEAVVPREERKLVSILFVDLVGFTARSDQADPEDVRDALQLYHASAKRQIEQHGGVLEKFIGDAVMAVFGAPVAHGDDAERAVRAGLRVLEGIGAEPRTRPRPRRACGGEHRRRARVAGFTGRRSPGDG
jgi:class 3 adenylate cyclase